MDSANIAQSSMLQVDTEEREHLNGAQSFVVQFDAEEQDPLTKSPGHTPRISFNKLGVLAVLFLAGMLLLSQGAARSDHTGALRSRVSDGTISRAALKSGSLPWKKAFDLTRVSTSGLQKNIKRIRDNTAKVKRDIDAWASKHHWHDEKKKSAILAALARSTVDLATTESDFSAFLSVQYRVFCALGVKIQAALDGFSGGQEEEFLVHERKFLDRALDKAKEQINGLEVKFTELKFSFSVLVANATDIANQQRDAIDRLNDWEASGHKGAWAMAGGGCAVSIVAAGVATFVTLPIVPLTGSAAAAGATAACATMGAEATIGSVAMHAKADEVRHVLMGMSKRFDTISSSCKEVVVQAQQDYDDLKRVKNEVDVTQVFISDETVSDWIDEVMPEVQLLEETLSTVASGE